MARYRKYRNKPVFAYGIQFRSYIERDRYAFLLSKQTSGEIVDLRYEPGPYQIIPRTVGPDGAAHRKAEYTPDFTYTHVETGQFVVEDTKGKVDASASLRIRLLASLHPDWLVRIIKDPTIWKPVRKPPRRSRAAGAASRSKTRLL